MVELKDFASSRRPTWCPGCGDFGVLNAMKRALVKAELAPHEVIIYTGIGCGSKLPDYMRVNGFTSLHGRPIPIAQGAHLANHGLKAIVVAGDGDTYGEAGNHLLHALRRNADVTIMVQNNRVYGLTKGQYSPTSPKGFPTKTSPPPQGAIDQPVNPIALALAAGATFIARSWSGDLRHLIDMMVAAIRHEGAALLDIFQPCVTFNPNYSYDYYRPRVYKLGEEEGYDPSDLNAAWEKAHQWGDRIPIGVIYQVEGKPSYEQQVPTLDAGPLVKQRLRTWTEEDYEALEAEFT
jgi:2-oxoglutarate ferredoxin oxidoreductase subunit beta